MVPARDGIALATDVYLPAGAGPFPLVLARTPYNKNGGFVAGLAQAVNRHGYAYAIEDVRGRGDSGGEFAPYRHDGPDGYDAVEWLASQEWCDGNVVTRGASYGGRIQWLTALLKPPHLRGMVVSVTPSDPFVEQQTGAEGPMHVSWNRLVEGRVLQNADIADWMEVYKHLPLLDLDHAAGFHSEHWRNDMAHPTLDEFWEPVRYQHRLGELEIPVLHISGWYDDEQVGTPFNFAALQHVPGNAMLMGPWPHQVNSTSKLGEVDFGASAVIDLEAFIAEWLGRVLGKSSGSAAPVRLFVMGDNVWRDEHEWPLARTVWTDYNLRSAGSAQSRHGDGRLSTEAPPADEPADVYLHDPARPVPFLTEPKSSQLGGPDDYASVQNRADVLCYTTEALEADLELTGPIKLHLFVSTSAVDTDFMATFCDVHPSGFAQRLTDGAVRLRYRDGFEREVWAEPGRAYEVVVDLWNTSHMFFAGHRIRLQIASTGFPKHARNLGTDEPFATGTTMVQAENRVFHDAQRPSRLVLPVIPR